MLVVLWLVLAVLGGGLAGALLAARFARRGADRLAAATLAGLHVAALVVDERDVVVLSNEAARRMGLLRGDQLALNELRSLVAEARERNGPRDAEVRLLHGWLPRDPVAVHARVAPVGPRGHVGLLVEDVTEARRVEDMRRDFVANVSHELKTPVGALSLLSEALHDASDDAEAVRRFSERMRQESTRLGRLVTELIELSRLEAGQLSGETRTLAVGELVAEALDRTRLHAGDRGIGVTSEVDPLAAVHGNRAQLVTALVNLVDNAIAYSPPGTQVTVRVTRSDLAGAHGVVIAVVDQGIGIAEEDKDRIFERFYRADPARSRATGGTGLGLAIVKHTAANHGGRVDVSSRPGRGSTFTLTLPAAATGATPPARASAGAHR